MFFVLTIRLCIFIALPPIALTLRSEERRVVQKVISPSLVVSQSNAFPMLVILSSVTKVWARTQHAPSFGVVRTAVRLHLRNQIMYLPTVSFCVLPSYVLWAYFISPLKVFILYGC